MFFDPGCSPRSRTITFMPASARTYAADMPAGPAPTIATSKASFTATPFDFDALTSGLNTLNQLWYDLQIVSNNSIVSNLHQRSISIYVDGNYLLGALHANQI